MPIKTSIDVLPSKNQVLCNIADTLIGLFPFSSREKELITKEHIVMHMHLNFVFKWALHFSISNKLFNSGLQLF